MELATRRVARGFASRAPLGALLWLVAACSGAEDPGGHDTDLAELRAIARGASALPTVSSPAVDLSTLTVHGYLCDENGFRFIDAPQATGGTYVNSLNHVGEIVGTYFAGTPLRAHGFLRRADGTFQTVDHRDSMNTFL